MYIQTCCGGWLLKSLKVSFWFLLFDGTDMLLFALWLFIVDFIMVRPKAWISTNVSNWMLFLLCFQISPNSMYLDDVCLLMYSSIEFRLENVNEKLKTITEKNKQYFRSVLFSFSLSFNISLFSKRALIQHLIRCWLSCSEITWEKNRRSSLAHCLLYCCGDGVISNFNDSWHKLWIIHISGVYLLFSCWNLYSPPCVLFRNSVVFFFSCLFVSRLVRV